MQPKDQSPKPKQLNPLTRNQASTSDAPETKVRIKRSDVFLAVELWLNYDCPIAGRKQIADQLESSLVDRVAALGSSPVIDSDVYNAIDLWINYDCPPVGKTAVTQSLKTLLLGRISTAING
jgi:hypothetical protein